jgi:glycosyltransferase involved in cell wall biosynthesis
MSDLPAPGWLARLRHRDRPRHRAEAALRRLSIRTSDARGRGMARAVEARLGPATYLNVGHSNLLQPLWSGLAPLSRVVLIHDTIPLDHPEYTRAGQSAKFRERLVAALGQADLVLTISQATRDDVLRWRKALHLPERAAVVPAPIGTRLNPADPAAIPAGLDLSRPFFVTIGTIEPRKNHALLLDAWAELARRLLPAQLPQLFIIGRRGWENHETFARLDSLPPTAGIHEMNGLPDGAVAALLERSHGLLLPSRAEGYGLPLTEAAGRGVPVICAPLPAARELLGDYARYLSPDDPRAWAAAIALLAAALPLRLAPHPVPDWSSHFAQVDRLMRARLQPASLGAMPEGK